MTILINYDEKETQRDTESVRVKDTVCDRVSVYWTPRFSIFSARSLVFFSASIARSNFLLSLKLRRSSLASALYFPVFMYARLSLLDILFKIMEIKTFLLTFKTVLTSTQLQLLVIFCQ